MDEYAKTYSRATKYSADHKGAAHLLSPESLTDRDRWGGPQADHTKRAAIADYLRDLDRHSEADLLQSGRHVVVHEGRVKPGRWTLTPLHEFADEVATAMHHAGDWEAAHPLMHVGTPHERRNHPHDFLPSAEFQDVKPDRYGSHDYLDQDDAHREPHRIHRDSESGLPLIRGSCFTCHDFTTTIDKAPQEWADLMTGTALYHRNRVVDHLDQPTRDRLEQFVTRRQAVVAGRTGTRTDATAEVAGRDRPQQQADLTT